jgi:hypothetical protein
MYRTFGGKYCLHLQGKIGFEEGQVLTLKTDAACSCENRCYLPAKLQAVTSQWLYQIVLPDEVPTARKTQVIVWVIVPCSLVYGYHCFGVTDCIHLQGVSYVYPSILNFRNARTHVPDYTVWTGNTTIHTAFILSEQEIHGTHGLRVYELLTHELSWQSRVSAEPSAHPPSNTELLPQLVCVWVRFSVKQSLNLTTEKEQGHVIGPGRRGRRRRRHSVRITPWGPVILEWGSL